MRIYPLIIVFLLSSLGLSAQEVFFATKEGVILEYKSYDAQGKESGTMHYTIMKVDRIGKDMNITYQIEALDAKNKQIFKNELTITTKGGVLYTDISEFLNEEILKKSDDKSSKVKISGNKLETPLNIKPGDPLPDANMEIAVKKRIINLKMSMKITERKVESIENISVKAGDFETYRFRSNISASAMGIKTKNLTREWVARGIGMIRSETLDKNGKTTSYTSMRNL